MRISLHLPSKKLSRIVQTLSVVGTVLVTSHASAAPPVVYNPTQTGLISWWRANGDATDSVGGHNGTLQGGMGFTDGVSGQAFASGSGKRVFVSDSTDFQLTSFTLGAWVNIDANSWEVLFRGDTRAGGMDPYHLSLDNAGHMQFGIDSATSTDIIQSAISYHQWHQVTATLDGTTHDMRLYIDGGLVAQKTTSVIPLLALDPGSTPGLGIGNVEAGYDFPLLGSIDEVLIYNRALSAGEVAGLAVVPEPAVASILIFGAAILLFRKGQRQAR